ncbi:response regulator [candidate division KSB1 bacterium]|nr:response regulator [candidate division KSB1 bacterium]
MSTESKGKILVIDDDESVIEQATMILQHEGYEISTANTVHDALELVQSEDFLLALCDIRLPDASGMEFLSKIREQSKPDVIMMTNFGSLQGVEEALNLGAKGFISKPLRAERIVKIVKSILAGETMTWEKIISEENIYSYLPPPA